MTSVLLFIILALSFASTLLQGWALSKMWAWFIVQTPTMTEGVIVRPLTFTQSVGIVIVINFLLLPINNVLSEIHKFVSNRQHEDFRDSIMCALSKIAKHILATLIILGLAYLWSLAL